MHFTDTDRLSNGFDQAQSVQPGSNTIPTLLGTIKLQKSDTRALTKETFPHLPILFSEFHMEVCLLLFYSSVINYDNLRG